MRIIKQEELKKKLVDHPYADAPDYHAAMALVHLSEDERMLIGYWKAPEGKVPIHYGDNIEYNYVIRGKITVHEQDGRTLTAEKEDIIECKGRDVIYEIEEYAQTLFIVYPQSTEDVRELKNILEAAGKVLFEIR